MSRNTEKTPFTTDNLRAKAAIFRHWATEIESLAAHLEQHDIHAVDLRFEANLVIGIDKVTGWVYDAKRSVSSAMFHGSLAMHAAVAEPAIEYDANRQTVDTEHSARKTALERKAIAHTKPRIGDNQKSKPKKTSG
jgi:hypothetical protein